MRCNHCNMLRVSVILVFLFRLNLAYIENYFYVGCYSSEETFPHNSGSREFWNDCIHRCYQQATDYAGVNARQCYCGDEIDIFHPVSETDCEVCFYEQYTSDNPKYCGGSNALSVYKLTPTSARETAILFSTNHNLTMWGFENNTKTWEFLNSDEIAFVAFNPDSLDIYYVTRDTVFSIDSSSWGHYSNSDIAVRSTCNHIVHIAVDWETDSIFWGCQDRICWRNFIYNEQFCNQLGEVHSFVIEPYRKFILLTNSTGVSKYNYGTNQTDIFISNSKMSGSLGKTFFVILTALDIQQERIYMICSIDGEKQLFSTDYNGTTLKRVVLNSDQLTDPFGMDVVNGTIVWGNKNNEYTLLKSQVSCSNTEKYCDLVNTTVLLNQSDKINDFKMYTRDLRWPSEQHLCEKKNCPQESNCYRLSENEVGCLCYDGLTLDEDERTCIKESTTIPSESSTTSNDYDYDYDHNGPSDSQKTLTTSSTTPTDWIHPPSVTPTTEYDKNAFSPTKQILEIILKRLDSLQYTQFVLSLIVITITTFLIILSIVVAFLICLTNRLHKSNKCKEDGQGKKSEIVELSELEKKNLYT